MNARVYSCHDNKTPSISSMREGEREREKALHITIVLIQSPSLSHYNFTVYNAETQIEWNMHACVCLWIQFVLFWFWCEVEPLSNTLDWPHEDVRILWLFCRSSQSIDRTISPRIQCKTMQFIFTIAYVFFLLSLIRGDRNELTNQRKSELLRSICSSL